MAFSATVRDPLVAQINITPLVDVMLVLLVIFMVSAPLVTRPLDANLPQKSELPVADPPALLQLQVAADGSYRLDGNLVSDAQLRAHLQAVSVDDPRTLVSLQASPEADYQRMVTALSAARTSGLTQIAVQP